MTFARLAWKDLMRNPLRITLTVLAGAVGVMAFVFLQTTVRLFYQEAESAQADRLIVRHRVSIIQTLPLSYVARVAAVPGVEAVSYEGWFGGRHGESQRDFFPNFYVDPNTLFRVADEFIVSPEAQAAFQRDPCGAVIGPALAERYGWKPGDRVTLQGQVYPGEWTFTVRGIYQPARAGTSESLFFFGHRCLNESEQVPDSRKDQVGILLVRVADPSRSPEVARRIDAMFANSPYPTKTESERAASLGFVAMSSAIITAVRAVSMVILFIILLVIANTLAMSVRERTRDLATLRAMGFPAWRVVVLVLTESAAIGLASAAVGVAVAPLLVNGFLSLVKSQLASFPEVLLQPRTLWLGALISLAVALLAGIIPALRAVKLPVAEGLRRVA